jgi:mono/diheme cytochrome c family protein
MAEEKETEKKPGAKKDPIVDHSTATGFLISSGILALTVVWGIADEVWLRRPYKAIQAEFRTLAKEKVEHDLKVAQDELNQEKGSPDYQAASEALTRAQEEYKARAGEEQALKDRLVELTKDLNQKRFEFQIARGDYQPIVYDYDQARHEGRNAEADELKKKIDALEPKIQAIFAELSKLSAERQDVQGKLQEMTAPVEKASKELAAKVPTQEKLNQAEKKLASLASMEIEIKQIYNPALGVVDRCQTCHVQTDVPGYTKEDWDSAKGVLPDEKIEYAKKVFATHPNFKTTDPAAFDALAAHPVLKFGCTSCHFGEGPGTTSAEDAHGLEGPPETHWDKAKEFMLTPLLGVHSTKFGNMMEASCGKCHLSEVELKGAPQLSYGRQLIEDVGCWGCHKIQGFEIKENELASIKDRVEALRKTRDGLMAKDPMDLTNADKIEIAQLTHEIDVARARERELDQEIKFIGPDLNRKDAGGLKDKIYAQWLPRWIYDPQHFRPGTWMPNPLLTEEQALDAAAYVWQQAAGTPAASQEPPAFPKEVVAEGKRLVEEKGCLACHALEAKGTGDPMPDAMRGTAPTQFSIYDMVAWWSDPTKGIPENDRASLLKKGNHFGPTLDRVGEKIRYEWLVKWVENPKAIQPHTRMPNLRLTEDESRKIAAFLTTLRKDPPGGEKFAALDVKRLEDKDAAIRGFALVKRYGCFNCHALDLVDPASGKPIANPGKIGAELSSHGSKPLAQFDFGFLEHQIPEYRPVWLQTKILEPRIWDAGKYKGDPNDRLRMPRFGLKVDEAQAITTVLVGFTDTKIPAEFVYRPDERAAAIIEGERLLKKFNCRSCHVIDGKGQYAHDELLQSIATALGIKDLDRAEVYLPPTLNGEGHRANPAWLFKFLKNPGAVNPFQPPTGYALRPWHVLKMPTFDMSDAEATALVKYFGALEQEELPYPVQTAPDERLVARGRKLFVENQCASCHQIGEYVPQGKKPVEMGPNFALAHDRLREDWIWRFVPDPQSFIPGTNMPAPAPFKKPYAMLSEEKKLDVRAIAAYLRELGSEGFRKAEGWVAGGSGPQAQ